MSGSYTHRGRLETPSSRRCRNMELAKEFAQLREGIKKREHGDLNVPPAQIRPISSFALQPSQRHQAEYEYLLGRLLLLEGKYDEAIECFARCGGLLNPSNLTAQVHLLHYWGLAYRRNHHYAQAAALYDKLMKLWQSLIAIGRTSCIAEDPDAYYCHICLQLSQCRMFAGLLDEARTLLENEAMPILKWYEMTVPQLNAAAEYRNRNWAELQYNIPWQLCLIMGWQARISQNPRPFADELLTMSVKLQKAAERAEKAAECAEKAPESCLLSAQLWTAAAEAAIQRCWLKASPVGHVFDCVQAQNCINNAQRCLAKVQGEQANPKDLCQLVLILPRFELTFCEMRNDDRITRDKHQVDGLLDEITVFSHRIRQEPNRPGYQVVAARSVLLKGSIEAARTRYDEGAKERAFQYFDEALALLPRGDGTYTLTKMAIDVERMRLGAEVESEHRS